MEVLSYGPKIQLSYPVGGDMIAVIDYVLAVTNVLQPKILHEKHVNIWVRGSSGAIIGAILASKLINKCRVLHIKKDGESSHTTNDSVHNYYSGINIIIDDFTATGKTLKAIDKEAAKSVAKFDYIIMSGFNDDPFKLTAEYKCRKPKCVITNEDDCINEFSIYKSTLEIVQ